MQCIQRVKQNESNIEFMIYDNADEVIKELFKSLLNACKVGSETSMRDSDIIFDCGNLLY